MDGEMNRQRQVSAERDRARQRDGQRDRKVDRDSQGWGEESKHGWVQVHAWLVISLVVK